jgi:uncharacterized protein (UPF0297 family)
MSEETTTTEAPKLEAVPEIKDQQAEVMELVDQAQSKKVFNLADAIKGRALPQKTVTVFLDEGSALELVDINSLMNETTDPEALAALEEKAAVLKNKINESALTFSMRGVNQKTIEEVSEMCNVKHNAKDGEGVNDINWMVDYIITLVAKNIISATDGDGNVDEGPFDYDKIEEIRGFIPAAEWNKLVEAMQRLTLAGGYFEQLTDAGFLQKS